jgi:phosphate transport system protein
VTTPKHLEESLQRDIDRIRGRILEMGRRCEQALQHSLQALLENNRQFAYAVILRDQRIDELEKEIDRLCLEFLVRQQPAAGHLRFAYATIKVNAELERIGDYAESIARQILKLSASNVEIPMARFEAIARLSIPMLHDAVRSFLEQNAELARKTMVIEDQVDAIRNEINAEILDHEKRGRIPLEAFTPLMTIARRFERVADQARNICEEVLYMCTGEYMKHKGAEALRVLFVDRHNSGPSAMAEAIGNSFGKSQMIFASAGLEPGRMDRRLIEFMSGKGYDLSRHVPKTLESIPNLEHYQVMIALDRDAQKVFPAPPTKTVALQWFVPDPVREQSDDAAARTALEESYRQIYGHIRDLIEAIDDNDD